MPYISKVSGVPIVDLATKVMLGEKLVDLGIKALWNFAPVDLHFSEDILVENVHLAESIMTLSYRIHSQNQ